MADVEAAIDATHGSGDLTLSSEATSPVAGATGTVTGTGFDQLDHIALTGEDTCPRCGRVIPASQLRCEWCEDADDTPIEVLEPGRRRRSRASAALLSPMETLAAGIAACLLLSILTFVGVNALTIAAVIIVLVWCFVSQIAMALSAFDDHAPGWGKLGLVGAIPVLGLPFAAIFAFRFAISISGRTARKINYWAAVITAIPVLVTFVTGPAGTPLREYAVQHIPWRGAADDANTPPPVEVDPETANNDDTE